MTPFRRSALLCLGLTAAAVPVFGQDSGRYGSGDSFRSVRDRDSVAYRDRASRRQVVTSKPVQDAGTAVMPQMDLAATIQSAAPVVQPTVVEPTAAVPSFAYESAPIYGTTPAYETYPQGPAASPADPCVACAPGRAWFGADALYWYTRGQSVPVLATSSPVNTLPISAGRTDRDTTDSLFGGDRINDHGQVGVRLFGGAWLNQRQTIGVEGGGLWLDEQSDDFSIDGDADRILARPFLNELTGMEDAQLFSLPGTADGRLRITSDTDIQGFQANLRGNLISDSPPLWQGPCGLRCTRLDWIAGWRHLSLDDDLNIGETVTVQNRAPLVGGTRFDLRDRFETDNDFHGAQLGVVLDRYVDRFGFSLGLKVALGVTDREVKVNGSTTTTVDDLEPVTSPGGLLALPSNIGRRDDDEFSVVPELNLALKYRVGERAWLRLGYTVIYWDHVARAGDQIDRTINPDQLPPAVTTDGRPMAFIRDSDFWMQGLNAGLEWHF